MKNQIHIELSDAGKKFGREWIFRNVSVNVAPGDKLAILGLNGSGKSTLLQAITGYLTLTEGKLIYKNNESIIEDEKQHLYISLASPYLELIEDFTLREMIEHVSIYKAFASGLSIEKVVELSGLVNHQHKLIKLFSSGMKQRLKLTLAILANTPLLFLDEPTTNLDATVVNWYKNMITEYATHKTIIVCSNSIEDEYFFCNQTIVMENFK